MQQFRVAISGFGSIGRQVASLLVERRAHYRQRYGVDVRLVAACGSRQGAVADDGLTVDNYEALAQDGLTGEAWLAQARANVLIEASPTDFTTGGAGLGYLRAALSGGCHGISISKGALVVAYPELAALAKAHHCFLGISGATAAALPTLDLLRYNLAGCQIERLEGILTATSNFVLSKMMESMALEEAISLAQQLGMAEPDPRFDLEGWDTACKTLILANAGMNAGLTLADVSVQGLMGTTPAMIRQWQQASLVPKLVGIIEKSADSQAACARVELALYPQDHPFALVGAGMKAVSVTTDTMGEVQAMARTSPMATAAAALKDLEHLLMSQTTPVSTSFA
ncbi:hypothetical protein ACKC9G_00395 [Pokkaliibacter sp. CJK22405]|uniref:hypothetical protein n=1 Tax=Pokkaliibacter sp. CJK22405 TaxID=3384615 RepID=UPI003985375B